jgi:uncharacterized protein (DUF2147 family)
MKKLIAVAVLALVSTTAQAKVHELKFGGRTARIEIPSGCKKLSCIRIQEKEKSSRSSRRSSEPSEPMPAKPAAPSAAPAAAAATAVAVPQAVQAAPPAPPAPQAPEAPVAVRSEPQVQQNDIQDDRRATARLSLPSAAVEEVKPAPVPAAAPAAEPVKSDPASPVGLWLTQKREAKIRVVACGANICGHVEGKPSEKVLINMKPGGANRWNGTIHDTRRGGNYSANIQLRGADALKVTGCAFGGMFCGGETWTRLQ